MSLARRIGTVTLLSMATNLAALLKNAAIAARFGVSGNADLVVYGEGVLLFLPTLLLVRECYGMFVSVYGRVLETKGTDEAGRVYASGLRGVLVAGAVLSLLLFLLPHALMRLIAPGLPPEQIARGAWLLRWISPALLLQEVSEFTRTVHNAHHRYVVPGIVLLGGNLFQAAALLAFAAPQAMTAWIVGLTGAALLQASLMVGLAPRFDPRRLASREIFHPEIRRLGRLVAPVAAGVVLIQIAGYLERAVLSFLPAGSLATLAYSRKVIAPLQTVLAASVALPIYVTMSRTAAGAADDRASTFSRGIEINVLLFIPIMVLIFLLAPEIVSLTFHRGRFRVEDVASTVPLLRIGILAILPASVLMLLRDFLYASARTRPLVLGGAIQLTVTAAANLLLARRYGLAWVPAGVVAGQWITCAVLLAVVRGRLTAPRWSALAAGAGKVAAAGAAAALAAGFVHSLCAAGRAGEAAWAGALRSLALAGIAGLLAYGGGVVLLGHPLARACVARIRAAR